MTVEIALSRLSECFAPFLAYEERGFWALSGQLAIQARGGEPRSVRQIEIFCVDKSLVPSKILQWPIVATTPEEFTPALSWLRVLHLSDEGARFGRVNVRAGFRVPVLFAEMLAALAVVQERSLWLEDLKKTKPRFGEGEAPAYRQFAARAGAMVEHASRALKRDPVSCRWKLEEWMEESETVGD